MNNWTRVFLVLLRLAIGWHFFFEGWEKVDSLRVGPTVTNRPFSSAGYLSESTGPMADFFRNQAGETDEAILRKLTVVPLAPGQEASRTPPHTRMPPVLAKEWKDYFDRFVQHYDLDQQQAVLAEKKLQQREDSTVRWLLEGRKRVRKTFPTGTVEVEETTPQRIQEYRDKVQEVNDMQEKLLKAMGKDVLREKLRMAKADANRMRAELLADLKEQTELAKKSLENITPPPMGSAASAGTVALGASPLGLGPISVAGALSEIAPEVLTPDQKGLPALSEADYASEKAVLPMHTTDNMVAYGLLIIGACLLLGLFSRLACVGGAVFLLSLYLAMPPFPWLPEPPRPTEGHYLFVSKNLIEMLALCALATTRSGRWAGLDGLVQFLNPWRWRSRSAQPIDENPNGQAEDHAVLAGPAQTGVATRTIKQAARRE
jgi:uncharacterized membrane protein YphA (DoxX/SURF4 family)